MKTAKVFALLLIVFGFVGLYFLKDANPVVRLVASSLGMIGVIKIAAMIWQISDGVKFHSRLGIFVFLFAWPGISASGLTDRAQVLETTGSRFFEAWLTFLLGIGILVGVSLIGRGSSTVLNYGLIFGVSIAAVRSFNSSTWQWAEARGNHIFILGLAILAGGFALQSNRHNVYAVLFGFPFVSLGFAVIVFLASVFAAVLHYLVEQPFLRLRDRVSPNSKKLLIG